VRRLLGEDDPARRARRGRGQSEQHDRGSCYSQERGPRRDGPAMSEQRANAPAQARPRSEDAQRQQKLILTDHARCIN
jgi:hypothetical protein